MPRILGRRLNGTNEVGEAADLSGQSEFNKFLADFGRLPTHDLMLELGQALKVPWEDIAELSMENGLISGQAKINLTEYFSCPLQPCSIGVSATPTGDGGTAEQCAK